MKNKGILKFKGTESKGPMHYITFNGDKVSLTMSTSRKVKHIKLNKSIGIANTLLSKSFNDTKVEIIEDETYVKEVYDFMKASKHTHYKKGYEGLVVLKYLEDK